MFDELNTTVVFDGKQYVKYHGNSFDRGSADSWYSRDRLPHIGGSGGVYGHTPNYDLTPDEVEAYHAGYDYNEQFGGKKRWD